VTGGFPDPGKILLPDELAAALTSANGHKEGLEVGGRLGAGAGGVSAAAQNVVDRSDQEGPRVRQVLQEVPAPLLKSA